jgi:hypothetical protein
MRTSVPASPATQTALLELSAETGCPVAELVDTAVASYLRSLKAPVDSIPGVDPAEVWESVAQEEAGLLTDHDELFARLRSR